MDGTEASLAEQLADTKAAFTQRATPERAAMIEAAIAALKASGIEQRARRAGDAAPRLMLPDALGRPVALEALWQRGPLILVFYRGGWCPYCNLDLRAWQRQLPTLQEMGATLVAVSPQTPDNSLSTAEKNDLAFPVLSDSALEAADSYGVSFELSAELATLYEEVGNDLPALNGNGRWTLPIPATFVIDRHGRIAFAHVEADYRKRAEPGAVIEQLADILRANPFEPV